MKALLLAAGVGQRLRPLTDTLPKCLMPIAGRPLLDFWLEALDRAGVDSILINTHHHAGLVRKYLEGHAIQRKVTLVHEDALLNTGGTLLRNRKFFADETILMIHADNLCLGDLKEFMRAHKRRPAKAEMTMMVYETDSPSTCGIVVLDEQKIVRGFHEKEPDPPGTLANAAVYLLEPSIFRILESVGSEAIDFSTQVLPHLVGRIFTWRNQVYHRDIGSPEALEKAQREYLALMRNGKAGGSLAPLAVQVREMYERIAT
jgi:mannose-1-phosphate guanylyltransferase